MPVMLTRNRMPFVLHRLQQLTGLGSQRIDVLTSEDPLPATLQLDRTGLVSSRDSGHTAQRQETTDDR